MWWREGDDRCGGEKVMIDVGGENDDRWGGEKVMIDVAERR